MSSKEEELHFLKIKLSVLELPEHRIQQLISELSALTDQQRKKPKIDKTNDISNINDSDAIHKMTDSFNIDVHLPLLVDKDKNGKYDLSKICKHGDQVFDVNEPENRATYTVKYMRHNETYEKFYSFSALLCPGKDIKRHIRILRQGKIYYLVTKNE